MYIINIRRSHYFLTVLLATLALVAPGLLIVQCASAQDNRVSMGEIATGKIVVERISDKNSPRNSATSSLNKKDYITYQLKPNQLGFFDQVSDLLPQQIVPVEILYPGGNVGEKIVLSAEDGGRFDNGKMIYISQLDGRKKILFNFHLSDQAGIFRVRLQKGNDIKVIQLWVGANPFSTKAKSKN